jgi:hypothetical protein
MLWANVSCLLPVAFKGLQEGIGSWFRAKHVNDDTNGNSWCGYPYVDTSPVFAPDLAQMTNGSLAVWPHPDWPYYAGQYCGLEAKVYNPATGLTIFLFVGDAFDPKWVKSPGSIDIMSHSYSVLANHPTTSPSDKNKVIKYLQWEFTGTRNPQYSFKGPGY